MTESYRGESSGGLPQGNELGWFSYALQTTEGADRLKKQLEYVYRLNLDEPDDRTILERKLVALGEGPLARREAVNLIVGAAYADHELWGTAYHDNLTGAWSQLGEQKFLKDWDQAGLPMERRVAVQLDVDLFKWLNTVFGWETADVFLQETVGYLGEEVRRSDKPKIVRLGGDDFRLYFGDISEEGFDAFLARLSEAETAKRAVIEDRWSGIIELWRSGGFEPDIRQELIEPYEEVDHRRVINVQPFIYINNRRICSVRDLLLLSTGAVHGASNWCDQHDTIGKAAAAQLQAARKKDTWHSQMGGFRDPNAWYEWYNDNKGGGRD